MKTKILLSFSCLLSIPSFAQDSIFQLKDYKYRTTGYRALELSTSLSGGTTNQKDINAGITKGKSFQLFPTSINYSRIVSTEKKLFTSTLKLNSAYNFYSSKGNSFDDKFYTGNANLNWQSDHRFFRNNNWFFQLKNELSSGGNLSKQLQNKNNHYTAIDELAVGFGKGRIEIVQDAQMALYILNDLEEQGLINHQLSAETINSFAQLITAVNNRRIFDFRRKRIYELTQIDSFLRKKGITDSTDIRHFTIINDNWAFGYNPLRSSGSSWFFHAVPFAEIDFKKMKQEVYSSYKTTITNLGVRPEIGYENYKPLNLKWQRDMGSTFSWSYRRNKFNTRSTINGTTSENETSENIYETRLYLFYGLSYYPNNRTRVNSNFNFAASYSPLNKTYAKNEILINPSLSFSADYFISYRTRLNAGFYLDYNYDRFNYTSSPSVIRHSLNGNFSVGISHSFL